MLNDFFHVSVCMHVDTIVHVAGKCTHTRMHACTGSRMMLGVFLNDFPPYSLGQGLVVVLFCGGHQSTNNDVEMS